MNTKLNLILALLLISFNSSCSSQVEMIKYMPSTERYHIFHPIDYVINEGEDGIVTITSPNGENNMTFSSYKVDREMDVKRLTKYMAIMTEGYEILTEPKLEHSEQGLKISGKYRKDGDDWIWQIYSESSAMVIISVNGDGILTDEQIKLNNFMLKSFELYTD